MAYMKPCQHKCEAPGCPRVATMTVFNDRNAPYGRYCVKHAREKLRRLEAEKAAESN